MFEIIVNGTEQLRIAASGVKLCIWVEYSDDLDDYQPFVEQFYPNRLKDAILFFQGLNANYASMTLREHDSILVSLAQKAPDFDYVHPDLADHW